MGDTADFLDWEYETGLADEDGVPLDYDDAEDCDDDIEE